MSSWVCISQVLGTADCKQWEGRCRFCPVCVSIPFFLASLSPAAVGISSDKAKGGKKKKLVFWASLSWELVVWFLKSPENVTC